MDSRQKVERMKSKFNEEDHPRDNTGKFTEKGESSSKKQSDFGIENLQDNIHKILSGTIDERKVLESKYFKIAETPESLKKQGLTGDYFTIRYGVITRHLSKNNEHNLTVNEWNELCENIKSPIKIIKYKNNEKSFRLFTNINKNGKVVIVGVDVKNVGKNIEVNSIQTVFKQK